MSSSVISVGCDDYPRRDPWTGPRPPQPPFPTSRRW